MYQILDKQILAPAIKQFVVYAPHVAKMAQPGQFVIVRINDEAERIPLTIVEYDRDLGAITLIFKEVGKSTLDLGCLEKGDVILDLAGPLGNAATITKSGRVICVGGGVGVASLYPIIKALKHIGNEIISVIGAGSKQNLLLSSKIKEISDNIYIATEDGTAGEKGLTSDVLRQLLEKEMKIDSVVVIGPLPMMREVCDITRPYNIPTRVSLHTIMVDGIGMCGSCRVTVGNAVKFACVDGPEFDGHQVDWAVAEQRIKMFVPEEKIAMQRSLKKGGGCHCQK